MTLHAIGDSHVLHMGGLFHPHHICDSRGQGATAHNLSAEKSATDSRRKLARILSQLDPKSDTLILSFGEIDCRLHIRDEAGIRATLPRYFEVINRIVDRGFRVVVHEVIGAVPGGNSLACQSDYPSQSERAKTVTLWNDRMRMWCRMHHILFLELSITALDADNCSDGVHLNDDIALSAY